MLIKSIFIHVFVRLWLFANKTPPKPTRSIRPFIHSFLPHALSFLNPSFLVIIKVAFFIFIKLIKQQKTLEICAVFGTLQIKTSPCIVPAIANQLLLGSNRRVLSANKPTINKLSPALSTVKTNQNGDFSFMTFLFTNGRHACETVSPTPRLNAKEFLDGVRVGK